MCTVKLPLAHSCVAALRRSVFICTVSSVYCRLEGPPPPLVIKAIGQIIGFSPNSCCGGREGKEGRGEGAVGYVRPTTPTGFVYSCIWWEKLREEYIFL